MVSEDHVFPVSSPGATGAASAFAPNGYAAMAWVQSEPEALSRVEVALRAPGGGWSSAQSVGLSADTVTELHVAVNAAGAAAVAWEEEKAPSTVIADVAVSAGGNVFGSAQTIENGLGPRVGIDSAGNVTLLYSLVNGPGRGEYVSTAAAGRSIVASTPTELSAACWGADADLAVAPSGSAVAGFACSTLVYFAVRSGGAWGPVTTPFVGSGEGCPSISQTLYSGVKVAMDANGALAATVLRTSRTLECPGSFTLESHAVLLAVAAGGAVVAGPVVAESGAGFGVVPDDVSGQTVGIGGGTATVAWQEHHEAGGLIAVRSYQADGSGAPGAAQVISAPAASSTGVSLSVAPGGQALASWIQAVGGAAGVTVAAFRDSAAGTFAPPVDAEAVAAESQAPSDATDEGGDGLIGWLQKEGERYVPHARGFDAVPPQLSAVTIPAGAQAGTPTSFGAAASDVWGPVSFAWTFGDGTAGGAAVTHSFAAGGVHTVTVTATDSAGNASSQSGTVTVQPPKPVLGPLTESRQRWREGSKAAHLSRAAHGTPVGTTFTFTLNTPAAVLLQFTQTKVGRVVKGRCSTASKARRGRRCRKQVVVATLKLAAHAGTNRVAFQGLISKRRRLTVGVHRMVAVAVGPSGLRSGTRTLTFTIVKR